VAARALGRRARAARLWGAAAGFRDANDQFWYPVERTLYEPLLDSARSQTDRATWEVAFAEGKVMTLEQAVEYALSEEEGTTPSPSGSERSTPNEPPLLSVAASGRWRPW
jgi:hypothetical protein